MTSLAISFCSALGMALVSTPLLRRVALRFGVVARPGPDRWHRAEIPLFGGVAMAVAVLAGVLAGGLTDRAAWWLIGGALSLSVVGLLDDVRPLGPHPKLLSQLFVATALAAVGLQLRLTGYPALDLAITIVWVVGITNAINLLDNMDGLAAGISAIAVAFRLWFFLADGDLQAAILAGAVLGAALGFLVYNFHPASVFMGDAGSLLLGVLVASMSLTGQWAYSRGIVSVLLVPVLLLLVPIVDTVFVTLARVVSRRSILRGGRDHLSHRLVAVGLSERRAVLLLYVVAIISGGIARLSYAYGLSYGTVLTASLAVGLLLLGVPLWRLKVSTDQAVDAAPGPR